MCIIAAKPAGIEMPHRDTIRNMWDANPDGAGLMYVENGKVQIEKGFMKYKSFVKALDRLEKKVDTKKTPIVMHFRIMTHGGVNPECTHPFPITDSIGALKKIRTSSDIGVAHNGIITSVAPRKGISDTMEYIATQLAPLKRALPKFYENKDARLLIQNAIESRMAFLTDKGKIYTIGDFFTDKGILYSNTSYKGRTFRYSAWGCYGLGEDYEDDWNGYNPAPWHGAKTTPAPAQYKAMNWLDDECYVDINGTLYEGTDFLIDMCGRVYEYEYTGDYAVLVPGASAYTAENLPVHFDESCADIVAVDAANF